MSVRAVSPNGFGTATMPLNADLVALARAFLTVDQYIRALPAEFYPDFETAAQRRVPRDPRDSPTVGLALALEAGVSTADAEV